MDGFKNSTRTQYMKGGPKHEAKGAAKIAKVMGEFKSGTLHSGSKKGPEVTSKKQAVAIAMSEARKAGAKMPMKKAGGGSVEADDVLMSRMSKDELAQGAKGVRMARERMSKERVNVPAKKLPPKAVPVAGREPLISPATMRDLKLRSMREAGGVGGLGAVSDSEMKMLRNSGGYKKGGLSAMPKSKGGKC